MLIQVRCRSCGDEFRLPEDRRGQRVQCRSCDELIRVPESAPPAGRPAVESLPEVDEPPDNRDEMVMPDSRPVKTGPTIKSSPRRPRGTYSGSSNGSTSALPVLFGVIAIVAFAVIGICGLGVWMMVAGVASVVQQVITMSVPTDEPDSWFLAADPLAENLQGTFAGEQATLGEPELFPSTQSPYVAVKEGAGLRVYDLRTLKPVGQPVKIVIPFIADRHIYSLSPDGEYIAFAVNQGPNRGIQVWSVATGQRVRTIVPDAERWIGLIDFAGKDRLLVMTQEGQFPLPESRGDYLVFDLQTGQQVTSFSHDLLYHPKWGGLSNSHRYMVLEETNDVHFALQCWDLTTGQKVGKMNFQTKADPWGQACGIAFSPDGTEMAMLWRVGRGENWGKIFVWQTATCQKVAEYRIGEATPSQDSLWSEGGMRTFQWIPDGSGWLLFGHLLVDRKSGEVTGRIPPEPNSLGYTRRMIDRDHITTDTPPFDKRLRVTRVPR